MSSSKSVNLSARRVRESSVSSVAELEAPLRELQRRGIIAQYEVRERFDYDGLEIYVRFFNGATRSWLVSKSQIMQTRDASFMWADRLYRECMRYADYQEESLSYPRFAIDNSVQPFDPPTEEPKPKEPKSNGIRVTVAAYRLDTIEFIVEEK